MASRLDRSPVATWWWTVDRWFLAAFLSLMGLGIILSFAASPAVAGEAAVLACVLRLGVQLLPPPLPPLIAPAHVRSPPP